MSTDRYWINESGCYNPTLAKVIEDENCREKSARNKQVHDAIREIKNILEDRDLQLLDRIQLKDKVNGRLYK